MEKKLLIIFIIAFSCKTYAQGDLLVTPSRVIFEGSTQKEVLNLVNMGNETATYSVSFVQRAMKEDGSFIEIAQPELGQNFADPYVRIFPRQVTLAPREAQTIVLQYRRKADMRPGEYRSHLYFRSEKNYVPLGDSKAAKDSKSLSVELIPIFGMSIPVIIRTGETKVTASLTNLKLESNDQTKQNLSFNINRIGNISLYGDIRVQFIPENGKPFDVAAVNGVGVYTNINSRKMTLSLDNNTGQLLKKGKLQVTYRSHDEAKAVVYAATDLLIENL
jgi:hypothetical protein